MSQQPQHDPARPAGQPPAAPPQWQPPQSPYLPQPYGPPPCPQQPPYWPQPQQVAPKSVLGAVVISFFIPGSGVIYAGETAWGVVILALWLISIPLFFIMLIGAVTGFACWAGGMIYAWLAAQQWNREHGIVS